MDLTCVQILLTYKDPIPGYNTYVALLWMMLHNFFFLKSSLAEYLGIFCISLTRYITFLWGSMDCA